MVAVAGYPLPARLNRLRWSGLDDTTVRYSHRVADGQQVTVAPKALTIEPVISQSRAQ